MLNALWFLIIGAVAGWAAGQITKGHGFGLWVDIILGVVGAYVGGYALSIFGIAAYGTIGQLLTATFGAVIVIWIGRLFSGGSDSNKQTDNQ
ncbi:GlsB/YeaQ/YmgE family stress response membrane protein [Selenomonadales bacterium OttesenSCG-928-I06]|nr:GlsB/YeaQ/YmgE family stress response membrane protein [Selenomonadales bacterium OttesenSCG-928-I06]